MCLLELLQGVYVKLDKCKQEFLPPIRFQTHAIAGVCRKCFQCLAFEGWILVEPGTRAWTLADPVTSTTLQVQRTQLPLMPEAACGLYSLQGATCDLGLIAHFVLPKRTDNYVKWLIVYVIISRVRTLSRLRSIGIISQMHKLIERGPPIMIAENLEKLFHDKITNTINAA